MAPRSRNRNPRTRRTPGGGRTRGVTFNPQQATLNPPLVVTAPPQRIKLRFRATNPSTITVTRACLLSLACSVNENITTSVVPIVTGVKVNKVSIWMGGGNASSTDFTWLSDLGQDIRLTRACMSGIASEMATKPPRMSRAGMWSRADSTAATLGEVLFQINSAPNSDTGSTTYLVDVDLSVTRADIQDPGAAFGGNAFITTTANAITSGTYYAALDCIAPGVLTVGNWNALPEGVTALFATKPAVFTRVES